MLPRAFRDPSESSASVNCTASDELPGTFRVKRQKKIKTNICFREASVNLPSQAASWMANQKNAYAILPRTFRVKRPFEKASFRGASEDLPSQAPSRTTDKKTLLTQNSCALPSQAPSATLCLSLFASPLHRCRLPLHCQNNLSLRDPYGDLT